MKKEQPRLEIIKNSPQDGPEGQSRQVSSTMCDAGFPIYHSSFLSEEWSEKVSMKKGRKEKQVKKGGRERPYI